MILFFIILIKTACLTKGWIWLNIDANVQKVFSALLKKWKLIIVFAIIGAIIAGIATAKFTTLTYTSTIEFLAYANDSAQELADSTGSAQSSTHAQQASQTSKMNYAMKMLDTYIEIFSTNEFYQTVADELNKTYGTDYPASVIKNSTNGYGEQLWKKKYIL